MQIIHKERGGACEGKFNRNKRRKIIIEYGDQRYRGRDWDAFRNFRLGVCFQSENSGRGKCIQTPILGGQSQKDGIYLANSPSPMPPPLDTSLGGRKQGSGGGNFFEPPPPPWPKNGIASASRLFAQKKKPPL